MQIGRRGLECEMLLAEYDWPCSEMQRPAPAIQDTVIVGFYFKRTFISTQEYIEIIGLGLDCGSFFGQGSSQQSVNCAELFPQRDGAEL